MTPTLLQSFEAYIEKEKLFQKNDTLLVTVSGGVDSVVLCELCRLAGYKFVIAHCNFHLRDEESNRDEHFVKELAARYGVEVFVKDFEAETYALQNGVSIQVAARELRYAWFNELAKDLKSAGNFSVYILTAHHADDNIETVLMNFFRGTGVAGMRGMLPKKGLLVRPLLFAEKGTLLHFANSHKLSYVEDSSNTYNKYSRNFLRNQVIPFIQEIYPEADKNITENIDRFKEVELLYNQAIIAHTKNLLEQKGNDIYISVRKLLKAIPLKTILFEITKVYHFTAKQTNEIVALLYANTGKFIQSHTHRILKDRNWLIISPLPQNLSALVVIEKENIEVPFEAGKLSFLSMPEKDGKNELPASLSIACLDMQAIVFPLVLRKWRAGDYFYPLGMRKKKKVSRFLIDLKLSLLDKERTWVLEMDKKIIWIVGKRIDDRFKVTANTTSVLEIHFHLP